MTSQKIRKKRATQAERKIAADLGGRKTFLSGAGDEKADVTVPHRVTLSGGELREITKFSFRVESKTTESDGYTLSAKDWNDVVNAADKAGQIPVFVMEISLRASPIKLAAIPHSFFRELYGDPEPEDLNDIGKKSLRVTRRVRTRGWGMGAVPHRSLWFRLPRPGEPTGAVPGKKGRIVIIEYNDLLQLVRKA